MPKRILTALLAALFCASALTAPLADRSGREAPAGVIMAEEPYSALRLHILANSDGEEDQAAKLAVRDAVLACVRGRFEEAGVETAEQAEALLMRLGGEIDGAARAVLDEYGKSYGVQLVCGKFDFPDRVYENSLYPAGEYNALRVILGSGEGHNWWCVMFPPLCVITADDSPAEYEEDGTLAFKSFFAELFERIFG